MVDATNQSGTVSRFGLAIVVTVAQVITSVLAAYAFAILEFPGKRAVFLVFVATLLVVSTGLSVITIPVWVYLQKGLQGG